MSRIIKDYGKPKKFLKDAKALARKHSRGGKRN